MNHEKGCPCMYCAGRRLGRQIQDAKRAVSASEPSKPSRKPTVVSPDAEGQDA